MIQMQIKNAQLIQNALNAFSKKISQKVVKQGVKAAWTPLLKRAKTNARNLSSSKRKGTKKSTRIGNRIAKALVLKPFRKQKPGQYGMKVLIDSDKAGQFYSFSMGANTQLRWSSNIETRRVQRKIGKTTGQYFIPVAIEYGHAFPGKGGSGSKDVAGKPFMRPALDVTLPNAPKIFERHLVHAIHEENAKR